MPTDPAPLRYEPPTVDAVVHQLVVVEGLSYVDAISKADRLAREASRPYHDAAQKLREWLHELEQSRAPAPR